MTGSDNFRVDQSRLLISSTGSKTKTHFTLQEAQKLFSPSYAVGAHSSRQSAALETDFRQTEQVPVGRSIAQAVYSCLRHFVRIRARIEDFKM